jgi:MFS transporter, DHA1 family, multidrug resistance protein
MTAPAATTVSPKGFRRLEILVLLGLLTAFAPLSIDMYLPSMPSLQAYFKASEAQVQLTMSTFFVGFALSQSLYGPLVDRFGRKPPLRFGLALFIAASAACALSLSVGALAGFRVFQALGACSGPVIARAMVRDLFAPDETRRVFSALLLVTGIAPLVAPLMGGYLLVWFGWKAIFWTLVGIGAAALAGISIRLPETLHVHHSFSFGHILSTYRGLLADPMFLGATLATGFSSGGMFAYITGSPFVFINLFGVRPEHFGWLFGLNALAIVLSAQVNGRISHRHTPERLMRNAAYVQAIAGAALTAAALSGVGGLVGIAAALLLYLSTIGFVYPNAIALALANHGKVAGMASALLGTIQFSMAAVVTVVMGAIHSTTALPMAAMILVCGVMGVAVHLLFLGLREHAI